MYININDATINHDVNFKFFFFSPFVYKMPKMHKLH